MLLMGIKKIYCSGINNIKSALIFFFVLLLLFFPLVFQTTIQRHTVSLNGIFKLAVVKDWVYECTNVFACLCPVMDRHRTQGVPSQVP